MKRWGRLPDLDKIWMKAVQPEATWLYKTANISLNKILYLARLSLCGPIYTPALHVSYLSLVPCHAQSIIPALLQVTKPHGIMEGNSAIAIDYVTIRTLLQQECWYSNILIKAIEQCWATFVVNPVDICPTVKYILLLGYIYMYVWGKMYKKVNDVSPCR